MQIIKCITARKIFKEYLKLENSFRVVNFGVMEDTLEPSETEELPMLLKIMLKIKETKKKKMHINK
jgi:hypothetical protein